MFRNLVLSKIKNNTITSEIIEVVAKEVMKNFGANGDYFLKIIMNMHKGL